MRQEKSSSFYGALEKSMPSIAFLLFGLALSAASAGAFFATLTKLILPALLVGSPAAVVAGLSIFLGICCLVMVVCGLAIAASTVAEMVKDYRKLESASGGGSGGARLLSPASSRSPARVQQVGFHAERPSAVAGGASIAVACDASADTAADTAPLVRKSLNNF